MTRGQNEWLAAIGVFVILTVGIVGVLIWML